MTEHENMPSDAEQADGDQTVEDLDVPEDQLHDVAGGTIAVRKAGEKPLE